MLKTKIKTICQKFLVVALLSFTVFVGSGLTNTAYAAVTCEDGFQPVQGSETQCFKDHGQGEDVSCPAPLIKDDNASTDTRLVCKENIVDGSEDRQFTDNIKNITQVFIDLQKFLNTLIWPVLVMIGGLMDNSLLFGNGMEERLREIWIPIRNLVNILFVIALVGIALYNVLGLGDEGSEYSVRSILPKVIIGIIAVNFSFLGIKVFLDAINVVTVSIFALPNQVSEGLSVINDFDNPNDKAVIERFCALSQGHNASEVKNAGLGNKIKEEVDLTIKKRVLRKFRVPYQGGADLDAINATLETIDGYDPDPDNAIGLGQDVSREIARQKGGQLCDGLELSDHGQQFLRRWGTQNASLALVLNMTDIVFYEQVPDNVINLERLFINTLFSLMLYVIYVASFLALFVVLLARLVVMWVSIAVAPILLLGLAVPAIKDRIEAFGQLTDTFVKNALAPVGIAAALTIGWIMLNALQGINAIDQNSSLDITLGIPVLGLDTIQDLMVSLGVVAVVWMGVFSAASNSIAEPVTNWIKEGVTSAGKFLGTLPLKHTPLIPVQIPGDDGEPKYYTAEQGLDFVQRLGDSSAKRDQLARDIGLYGDRGPATIRLSDLNNPRHVKNKDDLYRWLRDNNRNLHTKEAKRELDKFIKSNREIMEAVRTENPRIEPLLRELPNATRERAQEIARKLMNEREIAAATGAAAAAGAGNNNQGNAGNEANNAANQPATRKTQSDVTTQDQINGTAIQEDELEQVRTATNNLITELGDSNTDANKIRPLLTALRDSNTNGAPTKSELTVLIGEENVKIIEQKGINIEQELAGSSQAPDNEN